MAKSKFLIIDGSSLLHRAFYALPLLTNKQGEYTNAVYGLANMLNRVLNEIAPERLVVCFDKSRITFRNDFYAEYKGQRKPTPVELKPQFELAKRMLSAQSVVWEEIEGFEADDIIGTLAKKAGKAGDEVIILTGDRDVLQLLDDNIKAMLTKQGITNTEIWDTAKLYERYSLTPKQFIDLKGLMGDASDNIPGIPGVGEKTALKLLAQYDSLEAILEHAEEIKAKALKAKVTENKELALLSKKLATIDCAVPIEGNLAKYDTQKPNLPILKSFYEKAGFNSLLKQLPLEALAQEISPVSPPVIAQEVHLITAEEAEGWLGQMECSVYLETDKKKNPTSLGLAFVDGTLYGLPLPAKFGILQEILENEQIQKTTANGKAFTVFMAQQGIKVAGIADDVVLAAYLLEPAENGYMPLALCQKYLPTVYNGFDSLQEYEKAGILAFNLPKLLKIFTEELEKAGMLDLYREVELPLAEVLAEMELAGISVDKAHLESLNRELSLKEAELTTEIYDLAGRSFNINSPKQLGELLFNELGLPAQKKTKTGYSTDVEVMEQLAVDYPIAGKVLEYRSYAKLRSTYAMGLQSLIAEDGRIHTTYEQTVAATGRLSSVEPNLQNIPIRDELGRRLRGAFRAAEGCLLLAADYSQIELRVLAHISDDKALQEAFKNGDDIHTITASQVFEVAPEQVNSEQRRRAKAVNFGIIYGISDYGLSRDLGITRVEAKTYIESYLAHYPGVTNYMTDIVKEGKEKGYVSTLLGRKRPLPQLRSSNFNLRSFGERMALNTPIQGTAADIIKLAMLRVAAKLAEGSYKTKMLLQVHDELIFEVPEAELEQVKTLVKAEMEGAIQLKVPLIVDMKTGRDWYNMSKI
jgi:DNA polymerase-1